MAMGILALLLLLVDSAIAGTTCADPLRRPPLVKQNTDYTCGPAALRSILLYHGISLSEETLAERLNTNCEVGTTAKALVRELKRHGFSPRFETLVSLKKLALHIQDRRFPILHVQSGGESHWVVLVDINERHFILMDPWRANKYRKISRFGLNQIWYGTEGHNAAILW